RVFRGTDPIPLARLVARHEFGERWNVRQHIRTGRSCYRERAQHAAPDVLDARGYGAENNLHLSAQQIGNITAAIRNVNQVDTGHHLEPFAEDVGHGPAAGRSHVDLARIGPGVGDELRDRLGWNGWVDHHDIRGAANARDRRYFADEVEIELVVDRRVHGVRH